MSDDHVHALAVAEKRADLALAEQLEQRAEVLPDPLRVHGLAAHGSGGRLVSVSPTFVRTWTNRRWRLRYRFRTFVAATRMLVLHCGGHMDTERPIRVLVIDDHDLFRTGLRALLEDEGFEVADAVSGPAGIRRAPSFRPDVVVMDMNMPGMSGVEATPLVLEAAPDAFVLVLTVATDDAHVIEA